MTILNEEYHQESKVSLVEKINEMKILLETLVIDKQISEENFDEHRKDIDEMVAVSRSLSECLENIKRTEVVSVTEDANNGLTLFEVSVSETYKKTLYVQAANEEQAFDIGADRIIYMTDNDYDEDSTSVEAKNAVDEALLYEDENALRALLKSGLVHENVRERAVRSNMEHIVDEMEAEKSSERVSDIESMMER